MINKQQRIIHVSDIMVDNPNNDKCIQSSDTTFNRNYKSHFNGNRLIFVTFILLTILFDDAHHSVRGDLTGIIDCSNVNCAHHCPADSYFTHLDDLIPAIDLSKTQMKESTSEMPTTSDDEIALLNVHGRKRTLNKSVGDTLDQTQQNDHHNNATMDKCCESSRIRCQCDFARCQVMECPPEQYVHVVEPATKIPGRCCTKYGCSTNRPVCYSENLRRYFNALSKWNEDECTQCECSEMGETQCQVSHCKPLNCEDKQFIDGQCCPICDISNSKFCAPNKLCEIHCLNYVYDEAQNCTVCRCAASPKQTNGTTTAAAPTQTSTDIWINTDLDATRNNESGSESDSIAEFTWLIHLFLGVCIATCAFAIIMSITCRHICHQKGKHTLNHKQNTPLI